MLEELIEVETLLSACLVHGLTKDTAGYNPKGGKWLMVAICNCVPLGIPVPPTSRLVLHHGDFVDVARDSSAGKSSRHTLRYRKYQL